MSFGHEIHFSRKNTFPLVETQLPLIITKLRVWFMHNSAVGWQKRIKWIFFKIVFLQKTIYQDDAQVLRKFQTSTRPFYKDFGPLKNPEKGCQLKNQTDIRFCHKPIVNPVLSYNIRYIRFCHTIIWDETS